MSNGDGSAPERGLLGHWPGYLSPGGHLRDRSPEGNHGTFGRNAKWVWFTNPRAVRHVGEHDRTYVGYLGGPTGTDIRLGTYDHDDGTYDATSLMESVSTDDHTNPAVLARNDGRLLVVWSEHDGGAMYYRLSTAPEDPTAFGETREFDHTAVCYPNPVQLGEEPGAPLYLFYRERAGTGDGHMYYRTSDDGGETWSAPTRMVTALDGHYAMYFVAAERDGRVHFFFTDAEGGSTTPKWNVMYAALEDRTFYTADGRVIADESHLPLLKDDLEVVYDSGDPDNHFAWIWDAAVDADGNPAVVFTTFPSSLSHEYRYARWTGEGWVDRSLIDAGEYVGADPLTRYFSGGIDMPTGDPDVVYASVNREDGALLKRLETDNLGRTFASETVSERGVADNIRPVVPENAGDEVPVVWLAGAYDNLDGSQTVLKGIPEGPAAPEYPEGEGQHGVSLGIDLYDARTFAGGLAVSCAVETRDPGAEQTLVDFGGVIRLGIAEDAPGEVTFTLADGDGGETTASWAGIGADRRYVVGGSWDGDAASLWVDGDVVDTAAFEGPVGLDAGRGGWTLMGRSAFTGAGLRGRLEDVRLYNRPLTDVERERLADRGE